MSPEIIIFSLAASVFGLWLAAQKYFIIIPNQKYDRYLVRAIYTVPYSYICVSLLCALTGFLTMLLMNALQYGAFFETNGQKLRCIEALLISLIFIGVYHKYLISREKPAEFRDDFNDHEFFLFSPFEADISFGKNSDRAKKLLKDPSLEYDLTEDFRINLQSVCGNKNKSVCYTDSGDIIFRKDAADILNENQLTGLSLKPVHGNEPPGGIPETPYFLLTPGNRLPPVSDNTQFISKKYSFLIKGLKIYYKSSDLMKIDDFNEMFEQTWVFGRDYRRKLIVSKKAMDVFISKFGYGRRDFIPIHLIHD